MSEQIYITNNGKQIMFDYDSDCGCLCTFPYNNELMGNKLSKNTIINLALLGAGIAIAANKPDSMIKQQSYDNKIYYLPNCVPKWIRDEIERVIKLDDTEDEIYD